MIVQSKQARHRRLITVSRAKSEESLEQTMSPGEGLTSK